MDDKISNIEKVVEHWLDSANQNYATMKHMLDSGDYSWALFLGHLVIEKIIKAVYVKKQRKHAVFSHDLLHLAQKAGLHPTQKQEEWLDKVTTFNLNARYDNYKQDFLQIMYRRIYKNLG